MVKRLLLVCLLCTALAACKRSAPAAESGGMEYACWFRMNGDSLVVTSPYDGTKDTTVLHRAGRLVCMSSSHVGYLQALGADSLAVAVSGLRYLANENVRRRAVDIGYDSSPDFETIVRLKPDYVLMYAISQADTPALTKLRDLGIIVLVLHEHLEPHPLGRAEYLKLFGALAGCPERADSTFTLVRDNYLSLAGREKDAKALLNIPYGDQWYIPGRDNYLTRLIEDAGGNVLGSQSGTQSSVISVEKAYELSCEADFWLNPGWCSSKQDLAGVHPLFGDFPAFRKEVWNNTAQATSGGGNAFWETGPVRPDLILQDLTAIFTRTASSDTLNYYIRVK